MATALTRRILLSGLVGHTIDNGRFEFITLLGLGTYGAVYTATDTTSSSSQLCAIKCLYNDPADRAGQRLIWDEINLHTRVSYHANIVSVRKVISDDRFIYIVLDYCPGGDMYDAIVTEKCYARNDALIKETILELLAAVEACHRKGIAHRDLKPENILCSRGGAGVLLADFGLATTRWESRDRNCGSENYMSPECKGMTADWKAGSYLTQPSDIWSLGVIFVYMITGTLPWSHACPKSDKSYRAYLKDRHAFFRIRFPLSENAERIIKIMLHPDPLFRPGVETVRDRILALESFYMTKEEMADASPDVWAAYVRYAPLKTKAAAGYEEAQKGGLSEKIAPRNAHSADIRVEVENSQDLKDDSPSGTTQESAIIVTPPPGSSDKRDDHKLRSLITAIDEDFNANTVGKMVSSLSLRSLVSRFRRSPREVKEKEGAGVLRESRSFAGLEGRNM